MASRLMTTTGVVLALVLLFAVNILASRTLGSVRVDLTGNRLFTLSEGTRNILASLEEPVTLRFYLSQGEAGAGARHRRLRRSRARAARRIRTALRRHGGGARHRPRALLRGRGPRRRVRPARGAAGARRGELLLRPRGHELRGRRGGHPLLRGRARAVPRIRRHQARAQPHQARPEDRGPAGLAADGGPGPAADAGRVRRHERAALDGGRADAPALRRPLAASEARRGPRGRRRPDAGPPAGPCRPRRSTPSTSTCCAAGG